jgi:hypothetical protein
MKSWSMRWTALCIISGKDEKLIQYFRLKSRGKETIGRPGHGRIN